VRTKLFILLVWLGISASGQKSPADSLLDKIAVEKNDSIRQNHRLNYVLKMNFRLEESERVMFEGLDEAREKHDFFNLSRLNHTLAVVYSFSGKNEKGIEYFNHALYYATYLKDTNGIAGAYLGLCNLTRVQGEYLKAIEHGLKAEEAALLCNSPILDKVYNSLGLIFKAKGDFDQALYYFTAGLEVQDDTTDKFLIAGLLSNIGALYQELRANNDSALHYHWQALEIRKTMNSPASLGISYGNIGLVHQNLGAIDSALYYTDLALSYFITAGYIEGIAACYASLGDLYTKTGKTDLAISNYKLGEPYADDGGYIKEQVTIYKGLWKSYEKTNNLKSAFSYLKKWVVLNDSLNNIDQTTEVVRMEVEARFEREQLADSVRAADLEKIRLIEDQKQTEINKAQLARQQTYTYAGIGGFVLILIIAFILKRNNSKQKKLNFVIAEQKLEVEEKQKEILDSITYAKRIQGAILPSADLISKELTDSFILFQPKDIVAGDFYWLASLEDSVLLAVADCTGHGVPGAMVSVVCHNAMNRAVREFKLSAPGKILDKTRSLVIEQFEKSSEDVKDGMDLALCNLNLKSKTLQYAGANNPLWIIRDGELLEYKANKQPVGKHHPMVPFENHSIDLMSGDAVYLFSDGLVDQFGGEKGKKFKAANLKSLLLSFQKLPMATQQKEIETVFHSWRGNLEQVDDICILGFRIG